MEPARPRPEGLAYLKRAVARCPDERSPLQARLLTGMGLVADTTAPFDVEAARLGLEIATELGEAGLRARCLSLTALGHLYTDFDAAWDLALEAEKVAEAAGDGFARDSALMLRGIVLHARDRHDEADPLLAEAAEGLLRRGDRGLASTVLSAQSASAVASADLPRAREFAERAVEVAAPLGDFHRDQHDVVPAGDRALPGRRRRRRVPRDGAVPAAPRNRGRRLRARHGRGDGRAAPASRRVRGGRALVRREAIPGTYMASQGLAERGAVLRALGRTEEPRRCSPPPSS